MLTSVLLAYSLIAAAYGLADILRRYYGPAPSLTQEAPRRSQILEPKATGVLRPVETTEYQVEGRETRFAFPVGSRLQINGAAIFADRHVTASDVAVVLDDRIASPVLTRAYVLYIGEMSRNVEYGYSGFHSYLPTRYLPEGAHTVTAYARLPIGNTFEEVPPRRIFFLTAGRRSRFSDVFLRRLATTPRIDGTLVDRGVCNGPTWFPRQAPIGGSTGRNVIEVQPSIRDTDASAIFVVVDGKPYPARYKDRRFIAMIPAADMPAGKHEIDAYVVAGGSDAYSRLRNHAVLHAAHTQFTSGATSYEALCSDPLRQLAGDV